MLVSGVEQAVNVFAVLSLKEMIKAGKEVIEESDETTGAAGVPVSKIARWRVVVESMALYSEITNKTDDPLEAAENPASYSGVIRSIGLPAAAPVASNPCATIFGPVLLW